MSESHVGNESLDTLACFYLRRLQSGSQKWQGLSWEFETAGANH